MALKKYQKHNDMLTPGMLVLIMGSLSGLLTTCAMGGAVIYSSRENGESPVKTLKRLAQQAVKEAKEAYVSDTYGVVGKVFEYALKKFPEKRQTINEQWQRFKNKLKTFKNHTDCGIDSFKEKAMKKRVIDSIIRKNVRKALRSRIARRRADRRFSDVNANSKLSGLGLRYAKGLIRYSKQLADLCGNLGANTRFREAVSMFPKIEQLTTYILADVRKINGALKSAKTK